MEAGRVRRGVTQCPPPRGHRGHLEGQRARAEGSSANRAGAGPQCPPAQPRPPAGCSQGTAARHVPQEEELSDQNPKVKGTSVEAAGSQLSSVSGGYSRANK